MKMCFIRQLEDIYSVHTKEKTYRNEDQIEVYGDYTCRPIDPSLLLLLMQREPARV